VTIPLLYNLDFIHYKTNSNKDVYVLNPSNTEILPNNTLKSQFLLERIAVSQRPTA
jgi:hypothetical protein